MAPADARTVSRGEFAAVMLIGAIGWLRLLGGLAGALWPERAHPPE